MCIGDIVANGHTCADACPVCYMFTLDNLMKILSGDKIELGTVDLFLEVAQIGCRMCQALCELWSLNEELFQPGNKISARNEEDAAPGLLLAILFDISEPLSFGWENEGTGAIKDRKFKSWAMPVGLYTKGSGGLLDRFIITRPPNPSVARNEIFDSFKSHLMSCLSDHTECPKPNPSQSPTRVLRLDDNDPKRVFVHECEPEEEIKYIALSYCWGKTKQVMLLKANMKDFTEKGIDAGTLPKTIEDSITATRKLGVKYLWIDALCIIQDSKEDKEKEIVNMANIYKNATMTISAASAEDCGQGFLEDRTDVQLRLDKSLCLPLFSRADEQARMILDWVYLCPDPYMGHKVKSFSEEYINTRAWTYQESTLAPRLVIFGSGPPQWHCKESWRIPGLKINPGLLPNPQPTSIVMKITIENGRTSADQTLKYIDRPAPPSDDIGLWLTWLSVLENYSQRSLSFQTDKLAALSALAAEHQSSEEGTYAAGLWSTSLPRGLLWRRSSEEIVVETSEHPKPDTLLYLRTRLFDISSTELRDYSTWLKKYIAPSWSPMSSRDPIRFESAATRDNDEYHTSLVGINDIHVEITSQINPFGGLNFSYLDIKGPMCSMTWHELTANFLIVSHGEPFAYWDYIMPDNPTFFAEMGAKYEGSFNPQSLADTNVQHAVDDDEFSVFIRDDGVARIRMPLTPEPVSLVCPDSDTPFTPVTDVKEAVFNALKLEASSPGHSASGSSRLRDHGNRNSSTNETEECEFWLLEVERSLSPAGLVLKRINGDIFTRVGYFGMNRSLDPEIIILPGRIQVRGRKTWNFGQPEGVDTWKEGLRRKRIYLV